MKAAILKLSFMEFRRILVRATNWVGDAVMSLPALNALRVRFPQAHIAILARPWVADLYGREPFCNELIPYDAPKGWAGPVAKWKIAAELRARRFDCALLLQNAFEAAALTALARIPVRIGYDRDSRGWLLTHPVAAPKPGEIPPHQRFYYLELLKRAALIDDYSRDVAVALTGAPQAAEQGREMLCEHGFGARVIGVSPGAAFGSAKRWLPGRFAEASIQVARARGADVAISDRKRRPRWGRRFVIGLPAPVYGQSAFPARRHCESSSTWPRHASSF